MNRKVMIVAGLALCALASVAVAGLKGAGLSVFVGPGYFWGTMGTARNSANGTENIGCRLSVNMTGPAPHVVSCFAQTVNGTTAVCTASGPSDWNPLASLTPNSELQVQYDVNSGACQAIYVTNHSYF